MLAYLILLGTTIGYILGKVTGSGGGIFSFGMLMSASWMHILSTNAFITFMVMQVNIGYPVMILERQWYVKG